MSEEKCFLSWLWVPNEAIPGGPNGDYFHDVPYSSIHLAVAELYGLSRSNDNYILSSVRVKR